MMHKQKYIHMYISPSMTQNVVCMFGEFAYPVDIGPNINYHAVVFGCSCYHPLHYKCIGNIHVCI